MTEIELAYRYLIQELDEDSLRELLTECEVVNVISISQTFTLDDLTTLSRIYENNNEYN